MIEQLNFGFLAVMDKEIANRAEADRRESRQRNADGHLEWNVAHYPPASEEWNIILMGIRLDRHVHEFECNACKLGTYSHCPDALGVYWDDVYKTYNPVKVCLKDYFRWLARHGLTHWIKETLQGER